MPGVVTRVLVNQAMPWCAGQPLLAVEAD